MRYRLILVSAASWHMGMSMAAILVPLYAHSLGYPGVAIGALVSLPIVLQFLLRLLAGVLADRWTEKTVLILCYGVLALSGPIYMLADTFLLLVVAQSIGVLSRSFYYTTAQSYVSRTPGAEPMGKRLGFLSSANSFGSVAGMVSAGLLAVAIGFQGGFLVFTGIALFTLATGVALPALPARTTSHSMVELWRKMAALAGKPPIILTVICGFGASIPFSMSQSFYPLFVTHLGYGEDLAGISTAMTSIFAVLSGVVVARRINIGSHRRFFRLGYGLIGLAMILMPLGGHVAWVAVWIGLSGFAAVMLDVGYQVGATHFSDESSRASAFAIGGLGWTIGQMVVPISFGAVVDTHGYTTAFHGLGLALLGVVAAAGVLYGRLMPARMQKIAD